MTDAYELHEEGLTLEEPVLVTRARGTYVVKKEHHRGPGGRGA